MATFQAHLEHLRTKPDHIKRRIAFWSSLGVTAVIVAFWVGSFSFGASASSTQAVVAQAPTPGSSLVAGVGAFFGDVWHLIFGTKKVDYSTIEVSAGK